MTQEIRKSEEKRPAFSPATDIIEREDGFHVFMDIPGVRREDLVLDLQNDELTISGATKYTDGEKENYIDRQFGNGEYRRTLSLSDMVDRARIKATVKDGVLELFLPKVEEVKPRRIEIHQG